MKVPPQESRPLGKKAVGADNGVPTPRDVIKEHIRLVKVLTKGTKKQQQQEAARQRKELRELLQGRKN